MKVKVSTKLLSKSSLSSDYFEFEFVEKMWLQLKFDYFRFFRWFFWRNAVMELGKYVKIIDLFTYKILGKLIELIENKSVFVFLKKENFSYYHAYCVVPQFQSFVLFAYYFYFFIFIICVSILKFKTYCRIFVNLLFLSSLLFI